MRDKTRLTKTQLYDAARAYFIERRPGYEVARNLGISQGYFSKLMARLQDAGEVRIYIGPHVEHERETEDLHSAVRIMEQAMARVRTLRDARYSTRRKG